MMTMMSVSLLVAAAAAAGPGTETRQNHFHLQDENLAIEGYDPVAYFPEGGAAPKKGKAEHELVHEGVRYRFASEAHKALFEKDPDKYEPAYGGWCAYAMGTSGDKVDIDPKAFEVHDGRLYLFYKSLFANTLKSWQPERSKLKAKADAAWKGYTES